MREAFHMQFVADGPDGGVLTGQGQGYCPLDDVSHQSRHAWIRNIPRLQTGSPWPSKYKYV